MLDYERRYKINDSYYTFLLQKRSEAQIRKASNSPDNAVMQKARTSQLVNANQKQKKYMIFFFIGLAIPAVLIILKELLIMPYVQKKISKELPETDSRQSVRYAIPNTKPTNE